jgi:hypothetical protein
MDNDYISDPRVYYERMKDNKKILIMEEVLPFHEDKITLIDISLHKKGPLEDIQYLENRFYYVNVRRGNSLIQFDNKLSFCRRGMCKFYDLEQMYLDKELDQNSC